MNRLSYAQDFTEYKFDKPMKFWNLHQALNRVTIKGKYLEFGVWYGDSINFIASKIDKEQIIYGFDSWQGLPEEWFDGKRIHPIGSYSTYLEMAQVVDNVKLISGWFIDTLPNFVLQHNEPTAFIHIDSDLYSSSKTIFEYIGPSLIQGSIIVFDEWFLGNSHKAFFEFLESNNKTATALSRYTKTLTVVMNS